MVPPQLTPARENNWPETKFWGLTLLSKASIFDEMEMTLNNQLSYKSVATNMLSLTPNIQKSASQLLLNTGWLHNYRENCI